MSFPITDINCMIGPWQTPPVHCHDAVSLREVLNTYRITNCVAFHSHATWDLPRGNGAIRELAGQSGGWLKPCYVLRPNLTSSELPDGPDLLRQLRTERPVAVRLFPNRDRYVADRFYAGELLEILNELAMPVFLDKDQYPAYDQLPKLAADFPRIRFVLLRQPLNESRYTLPLLTKTNNIYFDVSIMCDTGIIEEIVRKFGSERLLFGSGLPLYVPAGGLGLVLYARISDRDKENILNANWQRIERSLAWN